MGSLIGCLPTYPRQSGHLGLPLQLLPEETTLLVNEGACWHRVCNMNPKWVLRLYIEPNAKAKRGWKQA